MRMIDPILKDALENQKGEAIIRVLTWADQATWAASPSVPDWTWECLKYQIESTSAIATLVTANDYTKSAFTVFVIERGIKVGGVEFPVQSGLYFVEHYEEDYGKIYISGSSFPDVRVSIDADQTYEQVIDAFGSAIGKSVRWRNEDDAWKDYQFMGDGSALVLNQAGRFESILRQKYAAMLYEESPGNLVVYNQDSIAETATTPDGSWFGAEWSPELRQFVSVGLGKIIYSPDGKSWNRAALPSGWTQEIVAVAWSPELGIYSALSLWDGFGAADVYFLTSSDGKTWEKHLVTTSEDDAATWSDVAWSASLRLFCAVSDTGHIATSANGTTWTVFQGESFYTVADAVVWSPDLSLFCLVGAKNIATSPDGSTWTVQTPASNEYFKGVAWSPELSLFVAVPGYALTTPPVDRKVNTSPDGVTWTARNPAEANYFTDVAWSSSLGLFVAVSRDGTNGVQTSLDGITWTLSNSGAYFFTALVWSAHLGIFVAVATSQIRYSSDGVDWALESLEAEYSFTYEDGPSSSIVRDQSAVRFVSTDERGNQNYSGDVDMPLWNLGYLESTADAPTTKEDPYYKFYLKKAPVRLDVTDGDRVHFVPYWSIDPTKTIDAMVEVVEIFDVNQSPAWYQEIRSIVMFDKTAGGVLPVAVAKAGAYIPLASTGFDGNLDQSVTNVQALADAVDEMVVGADAELTEPLRRSLYL